MHRVLLIPVGVLAGTLALACGDNAGVTDPATSAPPSSEATVTRLEAPSPQIVIDTEQGLTALFGISFEDLPAVCAGGELQDLADLLIVSHPTRAGTLARALTIACSIPSGTVRLAVRRLGTGSSECRARITCAVGPVNGGSPASIS
ncbi:MAG TPA: hypothetical protein VHR41_17080 [Gemmatimonadales bacterium]|nr:hypothetical protein [Gemmatimonadales bacterium]